MLFRKLTKEERKIINAHFKNCVSEALILENYLPFIYIYSSWTSEPELLTNKRH